MTVQLKPELPSARRDPEAKRLGRARHTVVLALPRARTGKNLCVYGSRKEREPGVCVCECDE